MRPHLNSSPCTKSMQSNKSEKTQLQCAPSLAPHPSRRQPSDTVSHDIVRQGIVVVMPPVAQQLSAFEGQQGGRCGAVGSHYRAFSAPRFLARIASLELNGPVGGTLALVGSHWSWIASERIHHPGTASVGARANGGLPACKHEKSVEDARFATAFLQKQTTASLAVNMSVPWRNKRKIHRLRKKNSPPCSAPHRMLPWSSTTCAMVIKPSSHDV